MCVCVCVCVCVCEACEMCFLFMIQSFSRRTIRNFTEKNGKWRTRWDVVLHNDSDMLRCHR